MKQGDDFQTPGPHPGEDRQMPAIVTKTFAVQPADLDELNHVNNRVYVRWMEESARQASAENGWPAERYFKELSGAWMARQHWVEYLRACRAGDSVTVYTWVQSLSGHASLRRYAMKNGAKICCTAATVWNWVNLATRRAEPVPPHLAACFEIVADDDARLRQLGIARPIAWMPGKDLL